MIKILFITYNFPPEGGSAVQRIAKFIKYINNKSEIETFVLTSKKKSKIIDKTLLSDVNASKIISTRDYGRLLRGGVRKLFFKLFIPDKYKLWSFTAVKTGINIVQKENIDIIFSTSPPHSTHLVAYKIANKTNVRWIADFRDEWTNNPTFYKSKAKKLQLEMELKILNNCDSVVTVTKTAKDNFGKMINQNKILLIYNGYDEDDFRNPDIIDNNLFGNNDKLSIVYTGRLNQLHSPINLFKAINNLIESKKLERDKLSIQVIGHIENKKWINKFKNLESIINFIPYTSHTDVIKYMRNADVLLLLATNMNTTNFIPAKVYEYFRLKKKIYGIISAKGELWNMLLEYGNSYLAIDSNMFEIQNTLLILLEQKINTSNEKIINEEFIYSFNREKLAEKLYNLFIEILKVKSE